MNFNISNFQSLFQIGVGKQAYPSKDFILQEQIMSYKFYLVSLGLQAIFLILTILLTYFITRAVYFLIKSEESQQQEINFEFNNEKQIVEKFNFQKTVHEKQQITDYAEKSDANSSDQILTQKVKRKFNLRRKNRDISKKNIPCIIDFDQIEKQIDQKLNYEAKTQLKNNSQTSSNDEQSGKDDKLSFQQDSSAISLNEQGIAYDKQLNEVKTSNNSINEDFLSIKEPSINESQNFENEYILSFLNKQRVIMYYAVLLSLQIFVSLMLFSDILTVIGICLASILYWLRHFFSTSWFTRIFNFYIIGFVCPVASLYIGTMQFQII